MNLEDFIRTHRVWQWGGTSVLGDGGQLPGEDCTTFVASWIQAAYGYDPAIGLRGTYATAEEANAIVERAGGVAALISCRIEPLYWRRSDASEDGDIGIVSAVSGVDLTVKAIPAIRFGPLWAVMSPRGAMVKHLDWTGVAWRAP